jgi:hypothetical protein
MKNPQEEILKQPEYSHLMFGDGYFAMMAPGVIKQNEDGVNELHTFIKPHTSLRKLYKITDNQLNANGYLPITIKEYNLIPINLFDDSNRLWICLKTYDNNETPLSNMVKEYIKKLEQKDREIWILQGHMLYLTEQYGLAKNNPMEFAARSMELAERITAKQMENLGFRPAQPQ